MKYIDNIDVNGRGIREVYKLKNITKQRDCELSPIHP